MSLRSIPGEGSVFGFTIPKRPLNPHDPAPARGGAQGETPRGAGTSPAQPERAGEETAMAGETGDAHPPH